MLAIAQAPLVIQGNPLMSEIKSLAGDGVAVFLDHRPAQGPVTVIDFQPLRGLFGGHLDNFALHRLFV